MDIHYMVTEIFPIQYQTVKKKIVNRTQSFTIAGVETGETYSFIIDDIEVDLSFIKKGNIILVDFWEGEIYSIDKQLLCVGSQFDCTAPSLEKEYRDNLGVFDRIEKVLPTREKCFPDVNK